jgi:hypothetical protein
MQRWANEGGVEHNLKRAQENATRVLEAVPDAAGLQSAFDGLPDSIQTKVFDVLRLSPGRGRDAGFALLDRIERTLTPSELETAETWLKDLRPSSSTTLID